jgi:hypothetical protein
MKPRAQDKLLDAPFLRSALFASRMILRDVSGDFLSIVF